MTQIDMPPNVRANVSKFIETDLGKHAFALKEEYEKYIPVYIICICNGQIDFGCLLIIRNDKVLPNSR